MEPIHFGAVTVRCCGIGFETPPPGENRIIAPGIAKSGIGDISVKSQPFGIVKIVAVCLAAFIPGLTPWRPRLLGY